MEKEKVLIERKRITFDVHPEYHKRIKIAASGKGESMNHWVHRALNEQLKREENEKNTLPAL